MSSPSQDKPTTDKPQPFESESRSAGLKRSASGLGQKLAGVANIVHGAGEVVRGGALAATDCDRGPGKAIAAAGKDEIHRGLNKFEGKPPDASATAGAANTRASEHPRDEQAAPPALPSDRPAAADGPAAQRDTGVSQQATGPPSNDRGGQVGASTDDPDPTGNAASRPEYRPPPPAAEQEVGA